MRIYLIGFMGSGKTHTGRQLADRLAFPFIDLDHQIEDRAGMSIPEIFRELGEAHFRRFEQQVLHATKTAADAVISTGGGAPCYFDNMEWMNQHGITIYLDTSAEILAQRLLPERAHRPLLQPYDEATLPGFIESKLQERAYFYQQAQIIYTQDQVTGDLVEDLLKMINDKWLI